MKSLTLIRLCLLNRKRNLGRSQGGKRVRRKGPKEEEYEAWGSIDVFNISTFALHKQIRTYV